MTLPTWRSGIQEVAEGVFAYIHPRVGWDICNSGFIIGDDGVLVVDAMMVSSMVKPYLEQLRKITDKPIRYVVDTHHHVDHSFGNQHYLPAQVVGHRWCRDTMIERGVDVKALTERWPQYGEDWPRVRLTPPSITYEEKMTIHLGDREVELLHPGAAHTYGDTLVYLPKEKVLFTGDVSFHYLTPLARDGHAGHWMRVLNGIIRLMDVKALVPGHGPVGGKEAPIDTLAYLRMVRRVSRFQFQQGASVEEAARAVRLGKYAEWEERDWRLLLNVERIYQELRGELPRPRLPRVPGLGSA